MPNKKINELSVRTPSLTDLMIVGDPSTGYSYKATISAVTAFVGNNLQFADLGGIALNMPQNGQVLTYDGTNWTNTTISVPVISVFGRTGAVVAAEGDYSLTQLSDVTLTSPSAGQVLKYNGTAWVNDSDTDTGITSLNALTATTQTFATGTSGTDFAISSTTSTHTFNLPTASATNRGALSSADWSTFNAKQNAITLTTTGSSGASTLVGATLNIPTYTLAGLGGVSGSGTTNYLSKWTGTSALGNSLVFDDGSNIGVGTITPTTFAGFRTISINNTSGSILDLMRNGTSQFQIQTTSSINALAGQTNLPMALSTNGSERMRIFGSTGNISIGYGGSPTDAGFKVDVSGTFRSTLDANINGLTVGKGGGSVSTNTAVGVSAINATATGGFNTALGNNAARAITSGSQNTGLGGQSLYTLNTGADNTAVGLSAMYSATSSSRSVAVGSNALFAITTGWYNTAIGYSSLSNVTGEWNTALGYQSGLGITTGTYNIILGTGSVGNGITTGSFNTIIGSQITGLSSSLSNTIILADGQGNQRLYINNSGSVGIGTTNLTFSNGASGILISVTPPTFNYAELRLKTSSYTNGFDIVFGGNAEAYIWNRENGPIYFGTNNAERMRLTAAGRLLLGTTTESTYLLDVNGTARVQGNMFVSTGQLALGTSTPLSTWTFYNTGTSRQDGNALFNGGIGVNSIGSAGSSITITVNNQVARNLNFVDGGSTLGDGNIFNFSSSTISAITGAGTCNFVRTTATVGGITAGGVLNFNIINPTINQTTGTGTIYGFRFNPTNTAVLSTVYSFYADSGTAYFGSNVGIGTTSPNASALLDVSSTTKGFLPPRQTNAQMLAITTPAAGLMVYDTTNNKLNVYDGTNWVAVH